MKKENKILNMSESYIRKIIRNVINEYDPYDSETWSGYEPDRYYDNDYVIEKHFEESEYHLNNMNKIMDKYNDYYINDVILVDVLKDWKLEEVFNINNRKLMNYYNSNTKNINTERFDKTLNLFDSKNQNGDGGFEILSYPVKLSLNLDIDGFIKSNFKVKNLFNNCSEFDDFYSKKDNELFGFYDKDYNDEERVDALMEDVHQWFVKHEKNINDLLEDYVF